MRTILVDDEPANLENLGVLLHKYCPTIKIVASALKIDEAAELIPLHKPDLLFLDIQMGKNSGFDLLKQLEEKLFEVIFVTAYDHYGIQAVKFAALDYLLKPVNPDELIQAVEKAEKRVKKGGRCSRQQNTVLTLPCQDSPCEQVPLCVRFYLEPVFDLQTNRCQKAG